MVEVEGDGEGEVKTDSKQIDGTEENLESKKLGRNRRECNVGKS